MIVAVSGGTIAAQAEKRVALVIGNSNYTSAPSLTNPLNDANAIAEVLTELNFEVIKGLDLDERQTLQTFNEFRKKVIASDVALLFYAGHGLQVAGANYLIPTDASLESELDLQAQAMRLDTILNMMENPGRTSIVLLDACRDNPLARRLSRSMGTRSNNVGRGLARVETGLGTYIGFSTEPGNVALDGEGKHSPFALALLNNIRRKNQDIESIMRLVRAEVYEETKGTQIPWGNSSLIGQGFVFNNSDNEPETKPAAQRVESASPREKDIAEVAYWNSIKDAESIDFFQSYLARYPNGTFAPLARLKITKIDMQDNQFVGEDAQGDENQMVASLEPETTRTQPDFAADKDNVRSVQTELNRLGCDAGSVDGLWGKGSRRALQQFGRHANVEMASLEPSANLLEQLENVQERVCPLTCRSGFEIRNNQCVRSARRASVSKPETSRSVPEKPAASAPAPAPAEEKKLTGMDAIIERQRAAGVPYGLQGSILGAIMEMRAREQ